MNNISTKNKENVVKHSQIAFNKWRDLWVDNCNKNKPFIQTSQADFIGCFRNRPAILFAFGPSLKSNIKKFKQDYSNRTDVVIGCVDKAFKTLVENGIYPDYCVIADGTVSIDWANGVNLDAIRKCLLVALVYCSHDWVRLWAEVAGPNRIMWYLNKDNIKTHEYFAPIANYWELIEAASNVGNSLCVVSVKIFGAHSLTLYAFDYSWSAGTYYGNGNHKKGVLLGTDRVIGIDGEIVYTNENMQFSSDWLINYSAFVRYTFGVSVFNRTGRGILNLRGE